MIIHTVVIFVALAVGNARLLRTDHDHRIVGGDETSIENYPHQVSIEKAGLHHCGGSILSEKYVVTAAHCVVKKKTELLRVRVGTSTRELSGQLHDLEWYRHWDNFNMANVDYDVAVLKLNTPITFSEWAKPIKIVPEGQEPQQGDMLTVTGWGRQSSDDARLPTYLRSVRVPVIDRTLCRFSYGENRITDRMLCAGVIGKDSCQNDSGGPLVNKKRELVGIVSWGRGCATPGYPGVYANVAHPSIRKFIIDNSKE